MTTAATVRDVLAHWLETTDGILVGENVGRGAGVQGSTAGLLERFGADRVIDLPIADRTALGFAVGLALSGRPVCVELTATRSLLAAAEILNDAVRFGASDFRPSLTVRVPFGGEAGEAIDAPVFAIPGLRIVAGTGPTTGALLKSLLTGGVNLLLEPRSGHGKALDSIDPAALRVVREGTQVTLAAWGPAVELAAETADRLHAEGISAEVLDLVSLAPLDPSLADHVRATGRLVVVHPHDAHLAAQVTAAGVDGAFLYLESPPRDCTADPARLQKAVWDSVTY